MAAYGDTRVTGSPALEDAWDGLMAALKGGFSEVKLNVVVMKGVNEAEIKNESSFVDDLGADSLDTVELVMALEEEFETEIPDEDAEKITTVQQAIDYVKSHPKA